MAQEARRLSNEKSQIYGDLEGERFQKEVCLDYLYILFLFFSANHLLGWS